MDDIRTKLLALHSELSACRACPTVAGTPVHPAAAPSRILVVGQAPGPREAGFGRPFAWTAGKTLFGWFASVLGADEETVRQKMYLSAVSRCFPGKAPGGGDRPPAEAGVARAPPGTGAATRRRSPVAAGGCGRRWSCSGRGSSFRWAPWPSPR